MIDNETGNTTVPICNHGYVKVLTEDGDYETVLACAIEPEDVTEDGKISTPVSGECECGNYPSRKLFGDRPDRKP
jgi:hypothetical protein